MLATTAQFQSMVQGRDQVLAYKVSIDLPGASQYDDASLTVTKFEIEFDSVTDLPDGTRLLAGYTAAQATFTLSGRVDPLDETKTIAWLIGRYPKTAGDGTISPLYRADLHGQTITIQVGLYPDGAGSTPELLTKFVGELDTYHENSDGSVDFTCIDLRTSLRSSVSTPPVITTAPANSGLTSEFAIDYLLRQASNYKISTWPAPRPQCLLAVGFRASMWPEIGSLAVNSNAKPVFQPGAHGSAYCGLSKATDQSAQYAIFVPGTTTAYALASPIAGAFSSIEFWVSNLTSGSQVTVSLAASATGSNVVAVGVTNIGVTVICGTTTIDSAVPFSGLTGSHHVRVDTYFDPAGASVCYATIWIDGVEYDQTPVSAPARTSSPLTHAIIALTAASSASAPGIEALQVTPNNGTTGDPVNASFVPRAVLDPSLNPLQIIPPVTGDPWQTIQLIADAEQAVAGFFGGSTFRFLNRQTVASGASVRTITSKDGLLDIGITSESAGINNHARVGYTGWTIAGTRSTLYSLDTVVKVPPRGSVTITCNLDTLGVALDTTAAVMPDGSTDATQSWFRASIDSAGTHTATGVSLAFAQVTANQVTIVASNSGTHPAWLVSSADNLDLPPGTPLLRIAGQAVTQNSEITVDVQSPPLSAGGAASSKYGDLLAEVTGNPWIQTDTAAWGLAQAIVNQGCVPIPDFTDVQIVPDPRLEIVDRIHLIDSDRTGVDEYARIFSSTLTYDDGSGANDASYTQTLDAHAIAAPGGWIGSVAGRSEGAVTTYGY